MAMQLVRQSWKDMPLSPAEQNHLHTAAHMGGHLAAGLQLLAHELQLSSQQLSFLHFYQPTSTAAASCMSGHPAWQAGVCYLQEAKTPEGGWQGFSPNPRMLLTFVEEQRVLGLLHSAGPMPHWSQQMHSTGQGQVRRQSLMWCCQCCAGKVRRSWSL